MSDPLKGFDHSERMKPFAQQVVLLDEQRLARISVLQDAIKAELTHGGIIDRIAHETSIIGAWASGRDKLVDTSPEAFQKIREAAGRLDTARNEFIARMEAALDGNQHG